jgi:acylphosphatase
LIRVIAVYAGTVQGVGFRARAKRVAAQHDVAGYVRNLDDGRVELVAEGDPGEVARFLEAVQERMADEIREVQSSREEAAAKYTGFFIAPS